MAVGWAGLRTHLQGVRFAESGVICCAITHIRGSNEAHCGQIDVNDNASERIRR